MYSIMRMKTRTKQFHLRFTATTSHGLNGIEIRRTKCIPCHFLHSYIITSDVNKEQTGTVYISLLTNFFLSLIKIKPVIIIIIKNFGFFQKKQFNHSRVFIFFRYKITNNTTILDHMLQNTYLFYLNLGKIE
jgi:hypothetical protein